MALIGCWWLFIRIYQTVQLLMAIEDQISEVKVSNQPDNHLHSRYLCWLICYIWLSNQITCWVVSNLLLVFMLKCVTHKGQGNITGIGIMYYFILWPDFMWYTGMWSPYWDQSGQWRSVWHHNGSSLWHHNG